MIASGALDRQVSCDGNSGMQIVSGGRDDPARDRCACLWRDRSPAQMYWM